MVKSDSKEFDASSIWIIYVLRRWTVDKMSQKLLNNCIIMKHNRVGSLLKN